MAFRTSISSIVPISAIALVTWSSAPIDRADAVSWAAPQDGSAVFLQASHAAGWSSQGGAGGRNHLPSSVLPGPPSIVQRCSVDTTDPGSPPVCSTGPNALRCSARCDTMEQCSAFFSSAGTANLVACSTLGGPGKQRCSVLQPPLTFVGPSTCSAEMGIPGSEVLCSVLASGSGKACSAENSPVFPDNFCSTLRSPVAGGIAQCSVINSGGAGKNFCSVGNAPTPGGPTKLCSTMQSGSECSIRLAQRGTCSNLAGAPAGTCSAHVAGSKCSVIGGPGGTLCTQP